MKVTIIIVTAAGCGAALTGCGELYRRNELFSSAIRKPAASMDLAQSSGTPDASLPSQRTPSPATVVAESHSAPPQQILPAAHDRDAASAVSVGGPAHPKDRPLVAASSRGSDRVGSSQVASSKPARADPAPPSSSPAGIPASGDAGPSNDTMLSMARPATGDQILAGLLRIWNKVAVAELSSKVLFGIWPEDLDGRRPNDAEIAKRGDTAVQ